MLVFHSLHGPQELVIEKEINMGQLEELIEQAEDELSVIPVYLGEFFMTTASSCEGRNALC